MEAKCARPVQGGVETVKSPGIYNSYYFMYGTQLVSGLPRRTQLFVQLSIIP